MEILVTYVTVNQRGQPQRDQRRIAGASFNIGRGSQCQIHLPDPRVALNHARIVVSETGAIMDADPGRIQVNGRDAEGARLSVGDRIDIGPYVVQVDATPPGRPLALSVTLSSPRSSSVTRLVPRVLQRMPGLSKRRLSYLVFGGVLLIFLFLPILPDLLQGKALPVSDSGRAMFSEVIPAVAGGFTQTWNPGPLSRSHQVFGYDCHACHAFPFVQVRDLSCVACHKTIKEHVAAAELTGARGVAFADTRCAECHRDHKGMQMVPRAQEQCADCHHDVKGAAPNARSENVTDFATDHPRFRLSLLDADHPKAIRRVRQANPPSAEMVEHSNLKFNHARHLDPGGVRDPEGRRDAAGVRDAQGRRTVLRCADCHQPDADGRLMVPVSMERNCRQCHSLAFEPQVTKRQVPHGSEKEIITMLREFYARLVLGDTPPDVNPPRDLPRMRPGAVLSYQDRQRALRIADEKAQRVLRELFETREVCSTCHEVSRKDGGAGWEVAPVRIAQVWMPQALFTHAKHSTQACTACHNVMKSEHAGDIAMPNIAKCRECHVGARPVLNKVTSDCATCHGFHAGRDYWLGTLQAQMQPRGAK